MSDRFQRAALHEAEGADDRIAMKARITGIVQGVGFRAWTAERARAHGLAGYVRNEADGSVTALFSGPQRAVEAMLSECRKGPPAAKVDDVGVDPSDEAPTGAFASY